MKILTLNYEFPPVGGGGGRVSADICHMLANRNHLIKVQSTLVSGLPAYEVRDGYEVYRYPSFRKKKDTCTIIEMGLYIIFNIFPAIINVLRWKPDIIHVHFAVPTGVLAYILHKITNVQYVLTVHLGDVPGGVPDQTDWLFRFIKPFTIPIWKNAAVVTAVSNYIRDLARYSYNLPIQTIHNGVDVEKCIKSSLTPHSPVSIIWAGRFNPQKNLIFLINILKSVEDLEWKMDMIGDGPLLPEIKNKIQNEGFSGRITLHGWRNTEYVENLMSKSDLLLLPSLSEGMPVVGVQAIGHGLAVLGSDIGGNRDIVVNDKNGFLCPVNDNKSFEKALRIILVSKDKLINMKSESRKLSVNFDLKNIAKSYENVFMGVLK